MNNVHILKSAIVEQYSMLEYDNIDILYYDYNFDCTWVIFSNDGLFESCIVDNISKLNPNVYINPDLKEMDVDIIKLESGEVSPYKALLLDTEKNILAHTGNRYYILRNTGYKIDYTIKNINTLCNI